MSDFLTTFIVFAIVIYFAAQMFVKGSMNWMVVALLAALAALLLPDMQYLFAQDLITAGAFFLFLALIAQTILKVSIARGLALMVVAWLLGTLFLRF